MSHTKKTDTSDMSDRSEITDRCGARGVRASGAEGALALVVVLVVGLLGLGGCAVEREVIDDRADGLARRMIDSGVLEREGGGERRVGVAVVAGPKPYGVGDISQDLVLYRVRARLREAGAARPVPYDEGQELVELLLTPQIEAIEAEPGESGGAYRVRLSLERAQTGEVIWDEVSRPTRRLLPSTGFDGEGAEGGGGGGLDCLWRVIMSDHE